MAGFSERCRSAAREGARGPDGSEVWLCAGDALVARAVGEMTENSEPSSNVTGYTARTTGEGAERAAVAIVVVSETVVKCGSPGQFGTFLAKMYSQTTVGLKDQALPVAIGDVEVTLNWEVELESWQDDINFTGRGTTVGA